MLINPSELLKTANSVTINYTSEMRYTYNMSYFDTNEIIDKMIVKFTKNANIPIKILPFTSNINYIVPRLVHSILEEKWIEIPVTSNFKNKINYYSTFFHELIHAVDAIGKSYDVRRKENNNLTLFAKEELIAETGSLLLLNHFNFITDEIPMVTLMYLQCWVQRYKMYSNTQMTLTKYKKEVFPEAKKRVNELLAYA